jgi:exonuclease SbcD
VLIAGDLFDTGTPPSYARELYNQLVVHLHAAGVALLLLGGNHDSPATRTRAAHCSRGSARPWSPPPATIRRPRSSCCRGAAAARAASSAPYPSSARATCCAAAARVPRTSTVAQQAIERHYAAVHAARRRKSPNSRRAADRRHRPPDHRRRQRQRGGPRNLRRRARGLPTPPTRRPTTSHSATSTAAEGRGLEHVRYSGSPLPLGFDEAKQQKEMLLVDLDADGLQAITPLPVPRFQGLVAIAGNLDSLSGEIGAAAAEGTRERPAWLEITVTDDDYLADLPARIEALTDGWPVEVLRIRRQRGDAVARLAATAGETLAELEPDEVFARRLGQETLDDALRAELTGRYRAVVAGLRGDDA